MCSWVRSMSPNTNDQLSPSPIWFQQCPQPPYHETVQVTFAEGPPFSEALGGSSVSSTLKVGSDNIYVDEDGVLTQNQLHFQVQPSQYSSAFKVQVQADNDQVSFIRSRAMTYWSRLHTLRIFDISLLVWEHAELVKHGGMGIRAAQVVCWRRTMLEVAVVFYFFNIFFSISALVQSASGEYEDFGKGKVFGMDLGMYAPHFAGSVVLQYWFLSASLGGHVMAFVCSAVAVCRWKQWARSMRMTSYAYAWMYVTPFVLLLLTPFHWGIDIPSFQRQVCIDMLNGVASANSTGNWGPAKLLKSLKLSNLPGTDQLLDLDTSSVAGLRSALQAKGTGPE